MKKVMMMAAAAMCIAAPAFAAVDATDAKPMTEYMMKKMDTNGDGMVSKAEHDAFAAKMFSDADTNKDGNVSMQEMMDAKTKEIADMKTSMNAAPAGAMTNGAMTGTSSMTHTTTTTTTKK